MHNTRVGVTQETKHDLSFTEDPWVSPIIETNFPNRKNCLYFVLIILTLGTWKDLTSYCSNLVGRRLTHFK